MSYRTLGELGTIVTGKTPSTKESSYWNGNIPFITPKDIQTTKHVFSTERYISADGLEKVSGSKLPAGAICVSCIGNIGYVGITTEISITNQQINSIVVNKDNDIDFVFYLLKSLWEYFKNYEGQSTTLSILNKTQFSKIIVDVPDLPIQQKIGKILSCIDDKIELNQRINDNLERQAQALYKAWFVDFEPFLDGELVPSCFGLIPHNWSVKRLNEITQNIRTKVKDKKCKVFSAVNTGTLQLSEDYFTKQVFSKNICNYIVVEENDFAYNPARVNIGSIGMNDLGVTGCVSPVYVVVRTELDYHYFFNFFLKTGRFKEEVKLRASGSVRQSMNYSDFGLIEIVYPPHDIVKKFNSLYEPLLNSINHIKKENQKLSEIRDAILPQLMSGELDVSNVFL